MSIVLSRLSSRARSSSSLTLVIIGLVISLPQVSGRTFGHREFAGYLKRRIPHPLDAKVLAAIKDPQKRAVMTSDDVAVLTVFGHRQAVEAVRTSVVDALMTGFFAVAIAIDLHGDTRDVFMALAPLFRSAELLNTRTEDILAGLRLAGASAQSVYEIQRFGDRPVANRSLSAFGLREEGSGVEFRYV